MSSMDRRHFLALGGLAAVAAGKVAGAAGADNAAAGAAPPLASDKLLMRRIPSSGEMLPAVGLGTSGPFEVGASESERAPLRGVLAAFFGAGATLIDTSPMYSNAESVLGSLLTPEQHAKAFIATKVWTPDSGTAAEQKGIEQMQRSMALLKHKRIELMQVHNLVNVDVHLKTLHRWKAEGRIKYIGVTHYTTASYPDLMAIIAREKIDFVQFNYSAATREAEKKLLPLCADSGIAVIVNRAFEDGYLIKKMASKPVPAWASEFGAKSWAQILLKYVLAHPAVTCVIPATGKVKNLVENVGAGIGPLPDAKQRQLIISAIGD